MKIGIVQLKRLSVPGLMRLAMVAGLLLATLGTACQGRSVAPELDEVSRGVNAPPTVSARETGRKDPGFSDEHVLFGQSAAFTGPAQELGKEMRRGIRAAFHEASRAGGVHDRELKLESLNDAYEPAFAASNTQRLIENERVFALIGTVGTPTARASSPLAHAAGTPFIAPFTGAEFLRTPELGNVLNLRASYYQEIEEMAARLTGDLNITRVAVLYQNDSYGRNGLEGARLALERRGLEPVASGHYERNTSAVKSAVSQIIAAEPEAIIMIGAFAPVARAVELVRREADPVLMAVSFVGSNALAAEMGDAGAGVYVTQVVPLPWDTSIPVVARYHAALSAYDPTAEPGFVSLEGYLAGRLAIAGLQACGPDLSRECFLNAVYNSASIDIDGIRLRYGPGDNQGSDAVFLTMIGADGEYHQVDKLGSMP